MDKCKKQSDIDITASDDCGKHSGLDLIRRQDVLNAPLKLTYDGMEWIPMYHIEELPSAESEIIRCKDCKWKQGAECVRFADVRPFPDDFCSRAERRTDK